MESFEARLAVYIVRFGISIAALGLGIACWIRISRLQRLRMTLPDDLTANVSRMGHEILSVDESLRAHVAKEDMRAHRAEQKEAKEAAAAAAQPAAAVPAAAEPVPLPPATVTPAQVRLGLNRALAERNAKRKVRRGA